MSDRKKEVAEVEEEVLNSGEEKKKNYIKNYIILILIFAVCVSFVFYLRKQYEVYEAYQLEIPVIGDSLPGITRDDLEHYVVDNSSIIIYMCTASDSACRSFEKDFKRYVEKKGISDEILYMNLSDDVNSDFVDYFNSTFSHKTKLRGKYPAFVVFRDGSVEAMLQSSSKKKISISKVQTFLELYMYDEEDEDDYSYDNSSYVNNVSEEK